MGSHSFGLGQWSLVSPGTCLAWAAMSVDLVVVLSHLGHDYKGDRHDDLQMARAVAGIDAIVGGHSHTFLEQPLRVPAEGGGTLIFQVGFGGVNLGRMDFTLVKGSVKGASGTALGIGPDRPVLG